MASLRTKRKQGRIALLSNTQNQLSLHSFDPSDMVTAPTTWGMEPPPPGAWSPHLGHGAPTWGMAPGVTGKQ
ncbi:hypothetical protein CgunFtcFv8_025226 [Champsocephalus gunnari]|uniref:Uncharacterized protein n=1 Tax=Champsocephalus gunnari TaxID=52237 RepID=A0AAN8CAP1_CHAGU|nr:hypothetical protein CgunFtcFv8_025226 [Champsocephalus gunnari]